MIAFEPQFKASKYQYGVTRERRCFGLPQTGQRFGRLVVQSLPADYVWVRCDCGTEKAVASSDLTAGSISSCRCYQRDLRTQTAASLIRTERHGRLTFIREVEPTIRKEGRRDRNGLFRCDCGKETVANLRNVRRGLTTSCGCFNRERIQAAKKKSRQPR